MTSIYVVVTVSPLKEQSFPTAEELIVFLATSQVEVLSIRKIYWDGSGDQIRDLSIIQDGVTAERKIPF